MATGEGQVWVWEQIWRMGRVGPVAGGRRPWRRSELQRSGAEGRGGGDRLGSDAVILEDSSKRGDSSSGCGGGGWAVGWGFVDLPPAIAIQ